MRAFVLLALVAACSARPDVSLGYRYPTGGAPINPVPESLNVPVQQGPKHEVFRPDEQPIINKQFFIHSAPEDTENLGKTRHFVLGKPQKNYRVVFIKAPASNNANVKLSAEYAPKEEKTVIYVLSQKEPELDLNNIATPAPTTPSKPEVFFIKYKTPEEAAHAQKEIQAQYDVLGGESQVSDEGLAPVSSVVGVLGDEDQSASNHAGGPPYLPPQTANGQYLPPQH